MSEVRHRKKVKEGQTEETAIAEKSKSPSFLRRLLCYLFEHEDGSYLGIFRIVWGLIMMFEIWQLIEDDYFILICRYFLNPYNFQFKYYPFEWVTLIPFPGMILLTWLLLFAALCMTIGLCFTFWSRIFFFGISYLFLLDSTNYLNHMYLVCVLSAIIMFLPCGNYYALFSCGRKKTPKTVPKITLIFLRAVILIVYMFAGVVKINEDWLRAEPLRHWLGTKDEVPLLGMYVTYESAAYLFSYGGILMDFLIGPLLLFKRTFWFGLILCFCFHSLNRLLFNIGIFPFVMFASSVLFFPPDWFPRLFHFLLRKKEPYIPKAKAVSVRSTKIRKLTKKEKLILVFVTLFLLTWILFPLRSFVLPGDVAWNEAGHVYSWRMKLRDKHCHADFFAYHPATDLAYETPPGYHILSPYQHVKYYQRPWIALQYAHYLADLFIIDGIRPEIYAYCTCQLNYRPRQVYIDPSVNLAGIDKWSEPFFVTELEPLGEEFDEQYPWNWVWNFNWLWGINDGTNFYHLETESDHRTFDYDEAARKNRLDFRSWIAERENVPRSSVSLHKFTPPQPTNMVAAHFWATRGQPPEPQFESKQGLNHNTVKTVKTIE